MAVRSLTVGLALLVAACRPVWAERATPVTILAALRDALKDARDPDRTIQALAKLIEGDASQASALVSLLPGSHRALQRCETISREAELPALADFFRHFHACRVVSVGGRPGMEKWIKEWAGISADGRKLLLPIVMASFSGGPMGRSASRLRDLQAVAWREYLTNPEHPKACLELATYIAAQGNDRAFFSVQTAQEIKSQAGDLQAALDFSRSIGQHLPDVVKARTEAARFLATYGSVEDGNEAFRKIQERLTGWRQREARLAHFRAMCAQGTPDDGLQRIAARRREEAQAGEGRFQTQLALADACLVKGRDEHEGARLSGQAARLYGEVFEGSQDVEVRKAAWVGLAETAPVQAIEVGRPVIAQVLGTYQWVDRRGDRDPATAPEAERFGMWLADALWNALRELQTAAIPTAEKPAKAAELATKTAALFALFSAKDSRLHELIRMPLTAAHALAGEHEKALAAYARDPDTHYRYRSQARYHLDDLFGRLALVPGGSGRADSLPAREAQWKMGLYFLEHLTTEPQSAQRRAEHDVNAETQRREGAEKEAEKIRAEILGIWAEFLTRTLLAIHGTTYTPAANREPEPVDPKAVAELERVVTVRMHGADGKDFARQVQRALRGQRLNDRGVIATIERLLGTAGRVAE